MEIWKDIKGYEGYYQVSNYGRVKSAYRKIWNGSSYHGKKAKILNAKADSIGYPVVTLCKDGDYKKIRVHRLVAETFIPNPCQYKIVNHKDGGKTNNHVTNLEWCSHKYNINHAVRMGVFDKFKCKVRVVETGMIYSSLEECASMMADYKVSSRHISDCLNGRIKSHAGYHFERVIE